MKTQQRAAESKFGIAIQPVKLNMQAVRIGSAQDRDDALSDVAANVQALQSGGFILDANDENNAWDADRTYSVFAYSITADGPNETIVETRIRPNGRAKQEKRAA